MNGLGLLVLSMTLLTANAGRAEPDATIFGDWLNPRSTVRISIKPCGGVSACGAVVWATPKAKADARRGSGRDLIGQQLFQDFTQQHDRTWIGKVYVPDLNLTFAGSAQAVDATHLRARGCVFRRVLCKVQVWSRAADADQP
jgi:uncharacterized protein (DUF2147 family)